MIHILALAISLFVALARGGKFRNLGLINFSLGWLILAAFGLQVAIVYLPQLRAGGRFELPAVLIILSYVMLVSGVIANRNIGGMKLLGLGLALNLAVIAVNGGFMPISPEIAGDLGLLPQGSEAELGTRVARSKDILLQPDQTTLWVLSDIFLTSRYMPIKSVFSIGDLVSALGLFLTIQWAMKPDRKAGRESSSATSAVS